jgi:hypothetical protein
MNAVTAVPMSPPRSVGPRLGREAMRIRFPPRPAAATWPTQCCDRQTAIRLATADPLVISNPVVQAKRVRGLQRLLDWLADHPGDTWQLRWANSGAEALGARWRQAPIAWLAARGRRSAWLPSELSSALLALIFADVVRPALPWLVCVPSIKSELAGGLALDRDPGGFTRLREHFRTRPEIPERAARLTAQRAAVILAAKGGTLADITVGDVLELVDTETAVLAACRVTFRRSTRPSAISGSSASRPRHGSGSCGPASSSHPSNWSTAMSWPVARFATCWSPTCASANPAWTTTASKTCPTTWPSDSGRTLKSTTPASPRCAWHQRSPPRGGTDC